MLRDKERTQLRYLLKKAGCEHLVGQIPELTLRRHGAPKKGHDDFLLAGFELAVRLLKRDHGVSSRARALRMLARAAYLGEETAKRLGNLRRGSGRNYPNAGSRSATLER
jgi:hypothetical protein